MFYTSPGHFAIPCGHFFISCVINSYGYCQNRDSDDAFQERWESKDCEVAILNKDGSIVTETVLRDFDFQSVRRIDEDTLGYVTQADFQRIFLYVMNHKA